MARSSAFTASALTIDGKAVAATASFDVINPATGKPFAKAPETSLTQLEDAFRAAARAFHAWRTDDDARRAALHRAADLLLAATDDIAPVLTAEQGKPTAKAALEIRGAAAWMRYYADLELPRQVVQDDAQARVEVIRQALGPTVLITPWNFPIFLAAVKLAPALRAGNTVLLKPSPFTPLATLKLGEVLRDVFPPGVLNVLSGNDALGAAMTSHHLARKISFTGSIAAGNKVAAAAAAAADLKHLTLELGGNDPAIVLADADVERAAATLFATAFNNNGQACVAPKRIYAAESILPALVEALAERARAAKLGDGALPDTELGPINNRPQFERVSELVVDALARGGKAVTGGRPANGPGYFFPPTIVTGINNGVRLVDEEQFGPALPVVGFRNEDDAIARANATHFGLGASVWSRDIEHAETVASRVEAGSCWINTHTAVAMHLPFPGTKWSALGVEGGPWGLESFLELKVIHRAK